MTRTGFETEIDISASNHSNLVRAKAVNGDGRKLGWTDAADGNGNYFQAADLDDSQTSTSNATSSATGVSTSATPIQTSGTTRSTSAAAPSSSKQAGGASRAIFPPPFILEILAAGVTLAGFACI
jgi:hypothetical protein